MKHRYLALIVFLAGCEEADPVATPDASSVDAAVVDAAAPCPDSGLAVDPIDESACTPTATDYTPRVMMSATDTWAACISDDNLYHPFDINIGSLARVAAFEQIAALLFGGDAPSAQAFLDARVIYTESNGLESRVTRREDEHYPPAPMACRDLLPAEQQMYPDRCVGPVRIQPLLNDAFTAGAMGIDPELNAARIEAGLLWFLYVSTHKEATTCAAVAVDCDSHYAYYTGGEARADDGAGLSRYVRAVSQNTHDRIWDGVLAVRCWRDLDNPTGVAMDAALQALAVEQLDRALLRGVAIVVRDRIIALAADCSPAAQAAHWAFVQVLGPVLDREATERNPTAAAVLRAELAKASPADVDLAAVVAALDSIFDCP